jgi:hypothetical protein
MRDTKIESTYGYLGQYPLILSQGSVQKMSFQDGDKGPFWMNDQERTDNMYKYDRGMGVKKRHELMINELCQKLLEVGYTANGGKKALQQVAEARGISPVEEYEEIKEG